MITLKQIEKKLKEKPQFRKRLDIEGIPFNSIKEMTVGEVNRLSKQMQRL